MDEEQYQIIITSSAEKAYFDVLNYIFDLHTFDRANEIALELLEYAQILKKNPLLGPIESNLLGRKQNYRYLVYKRTTRTTVKIIYYVEEFNKKVYITDFFACEMNLKKLNKLR